MSTSVSWIAAKWYKSVEEMQKDLEAYLKQYNHERTHQGRSMNRRTPYKAFIDGIKKTKIEEQAMKKAV